MTVAILFTLLVILAVAGWSIGNSIERNYPPIGELRKINGAAMHFVDTGTVEDSNKPAIVFIHGAGGNLRDPLSNYQSRLYDSYRVIFVDRPGHGYSEPFAGSNSPDKQANAIATLLDELQIDRAVIVGHSYGGLVAAVFGVLHREKSAGLLLLAPASHPWSTGVSWHHDVGNLPVIGWLFSRLVAPFAGQYIYPRALKKIFSPNPVPADYAETSGTKLVLRPWNFLENARDVARVSDFIDDFHSRYKEINAPVTIIHGDADTVTSHEIHSVNGLAKDIEGSRLIILENMGHMPDHFVADQIEAEIRALADTVTVASNP